MKHVFSGLKRELLFCSLALLSTVALAYATRGATPGAANPRVDVILWFDTEDYILPADDDACKRLAQMLTERKIRATFKVVGEKARVLETRGRHDVISALKKHDIAYHANFHSVHPTPTEYLAECGWLDGIDEFVRREGGGAADVRRIFGVRTLGCYGQPGSSWAPQAIAALPHIGVAPRGVPCYVDEGDHVGLDEQPFWYAGALNVYHMGGNWTRMELHDPAAVEPAKQKVSAIAERLRGKGGGLISIFYHPCEWVHRQFWDGVNFSRGANPPREQWQLPPQRTAAETEGAFQRFGDYIDYIRCLPNVRFVTASELPLLYSDKIRSEGASQADLAEISGRITRSGVTGLDFQVVGNRACSLADQFEVLTLVMARVVRSQKPQFPIRPAGLLGPDAVAPETRLSSVPPLAFRDTVLDVADFVVTQHRVPSRVFVGADAIAPADFLLGLASAYQLYLEQGRSPAKVNVQLGHGLEVLPARHIAADSPDLFGGWVIHKAGFRAPKVLELGRLQAWTLKPAIRN
jgi:hypothetical protein